MTITEAVKRLRRFKEQRSKLMGASLTQAMIYGQRRAVTVYMQALGAGEGAQPPNPPPGPLGIRTGNLRRATKIIRAAHEGDAWTAGLTYDLGRAPYGAAHEFGVTTRAHFIFPVNKKVLRWNNPGSPWANSKGDVFAAMVKHPGSKIPPRPVLTPSLKDAAEEFYKILETNTEKLARSVLP